MPPPAARRVAVQRQQDTPRIGLPHLRRGEQRAAMCGRSSRRHSPDECRPPARPRMRPAACDVRSRRRHTPHAASPSVAAQCGPMREHRRHAPPPDAFRDAILSCQRSWTENRNGIPPVTTGVPEAGFNASISIRQPRCSRAIPRAIARPPGSSRAHRSRHRPTSCAARRAGQCRRAPARVWPAALRRADKARRARPPARRVARQRPQPWLRVSRPPPAAATAAAAPPHSRARHPRATAPGGGARPQAGAEHTEQNRRTALRGTATSQRLRQPLAVRQQVEAARLRTTGRHSHTPRKASPNATAHAGPPGMPAAGHGCPLQPVQSNDTATAPSTSPISATDVSKRAIHRSSPATSTQHTAPSARWRNASENAPARRRTASAPVRPTGRRFASRARPSHETRALRRGLRVGFELRGIAQRTQRRRLAVDHRQVDTGGPRRSGVRAAPAGHGNLDLAGSAPPSCRQSNARLSGASPEMRSAACRAASSTSARPARSSVAVRISSSCNAITPRASHRTPAADSLDTAAASARATAAQRASSGPPANPTGSRSSPSTHTSAPRPRRLSTATLTSSAPTSIPVDRCPPCANRARHRPAIPASRNRRGPCRVSET